MVYSLRVLDVFLACPIGLSPTITSFSAMILENPKDVKDTKKERNLRLP